MDFVKVCRPSSATAVSSGCNVYWLQTLAANLMSGARQKEEARTVTISPDLYRAVAEKSEFLSSSLEATVETLLQFGLEAQNQKEEKLANLARKLADSTDPEESDRLNNELGVLIFGE